MIDYYFDVKRKAAINNNDIHRMLIETHPRGLHFHNKRKYNFKLVSRDV